MGVSGLGLEGGPGGPRVPEGGPEVPNGGPGVPSGGPEEGPEGLNGGPRDPKGGPRGPDGGPRDPKGGPGGLDGGPRNPRGGPGGLDRGPRDPKGGPGGPDGGPGVLNGGPGSPDGGPRDPEEGPGGLDGGPAVQKGSPGGQDGGPGQPPAAPRAEQALLQAVRSLRSDGPAAVRAVLEAAAPPWLPGTAGAGPAALGELAAALGEYAAPPGREQDGAEPPGRDRECAAAAAERAEQAGAVFVLLLKKLEDAKSQECPGAPALRRVKGHMYIFAVTHLVERPWTTPRSRAVARELLELLVKAAGCGSVAEFLRGKDGDEEGAFGAVMGLLKKELTKDTWKRNPATKHVFSWTLPHVTRPWLGPHLERVLPPALLISDDFQEENKVLGVQCLHHIVLNVPGADLCQFNRAQVVFHALYNHLYSREAPLIQAVLLCLLDLLPVLERSQRHQGQVGAPSQWDEVLQLVLTHMEAEHRLALRRVYAGTLPAFVGRLGILVVRHLKRLERVILGYLEVSDGPEEEARLGILETLQCTIEHAWPRMPCRLPVLLKALLRLIWDVHTDKGPTPEPVRAALLQRATQCLILLDHCSQGQVKVLLEGVYSSCEENRVRECIRKVQEST